jgi:hypothetical protein
MDEVKARIIAHIARLGLQRDATLKAILASSPSLIMLERLEASLAAQASAPEHKPARRLPAKASKPERVIDVQPQASEPRPWLAGFSHAPLATMRAARPTLLDELEAMRAARPPEIKRAAPVVSSLADELVEVCRRYREE